ncbi:50S ribosomal protein L11 methyltransferase, partial [Porphyromonadaceae bacterium OttesenSCG-928-L07]|nr:50S ribosomal protein L11 methyltransferase [Porphyromonadaceae bacterium OttesenSCG-928-L07]
FNPRLATERRRVASQVKHGEIIIDMFAGVAPFPLVISKHSGAREIYAIDLNPDAMEFMVRNIEMNKVENITPMNGDARAIIKELPKADRVIMNLPQSASDFLEDALNASKIGATIHLHRISERDPGTDAIKEMANDLGYAVEVSEPIELKTYSPSMSVYVFDIVNKGLIS